MGNDLLRGKPYQGPKNEEVDATCSHPSFSGWSEHSRHNLRLSCLIIFILSVLFLFLFSVRIAVTLRASDNGVFQGQVQEHGFVLAEKKKIPN